ncbi:MAG: hypothetical protein IPK71_07005 [Myxococcales bacterium]|nr:hypothetical protein [Myxococcales bacterium]
MRPAVAPSALLGVALALAPALAHAAPPPRVAVRLDAAFGEAESARLRGAIEAEVRDVATVVSTTEGPTIVVLVEKSGQGITLSFADARGTVVGKPRSLSGDDEVVASSTGAVVRAHVVAATSERAEAPSPVEPALAPSARTSEAPTPRDEAPRPAAPHLAPGTFRVGAYYTGTTYAPELPWQSGVRLEGSVRATRVVYVGAGYALSPGVTLSGAGVDVGVTRHAPYAFVGLESTGASLALGVDVGVGLDVAVRKTTSTREGLTATASSTFASPVLALRAHGRLRSAGNGLALDVGPTFEAAPGGRSLVVADTAPVEILGANSARLRIDVGGTFDGF